VAEVIGLAYYGAAGNQAAQNPVDVHDLELCKRLVNDGYRRFINSNPRWSFLTPTITLTLAPGYSGSATSAGSTTTLVDTARTEAPELLRRHEHRRDARRHRGDRNRPDFRLQQRDQDVHLRRHRDRPRQRRHLHRGPRAVRGRRQQPLLHAGRVLRLAPHPVHLPGRAGVAWSITEVREEIMREMQQTVDTSGNPTYVAFRPLQATGTTSGKRWEASSGRTPPPSTSSPPAPGSTPTRWST
jgi:hypothetical protein